MSRSNSLPSPLPREFAAYAGDLLESLRKIAREQRQTLLAHLLALAALEAKSLSARAESFEDGPESHREIRSERQDQQTRLPG